MSKYFVISHYFVLVDQIILVKSVVVTNHNKKHFQGNDSLCKIKKNGYFYDVMQEKNI